MPEEFVVADVLENDDSNDELLAKRLESARALVTALEQGNEKSADKIVYEIASASETQMFQQVGQLTRQLHEAMSGFAQDSRLGELTENAIPDAKERLNYVITMTQQAADTTLNVVDELLPVSDRLVDQAGELSVRWNRFLQKEMPFDEFKALSIELADYFDATQDGLKTMQTKLNEIVMAQSFQDLTGQIIRRVINLVHDVEQSMVELVRISGKPVAQAHNSNEPELAGPVVPGLESNDSVTNQDDVDDLLSSLGF